MAYQCRARRRVHALPRAPDGSAFTKCEFCGVSVAISLSDMHVCEFESGARKKRRKIEIGSGEVKKQRFEDQPRSAFRFFVEDFMKNCEDGNEIEMENKACEIWRNMSKQERGPFVRQATKVNSAYLKLLEEEENEIQWVDDEADSAEVGKYDMCYTIFDVDSDSENSDGSRLFLSGSYETGGVGDWLKTLGC